MPRPAKRRYHLRRWLRTHAWIDGVMALAERSRSGLRQLLDHAIPLCLFDWTPRRKKPRFQPALEGLEKRWLPSGVHFAQGSYSVIAGSAVTVTVVSDLTNAQWYDLGAMTVSFTEADGTAQSGINYGSPPPSIAFQNPVAYPGAATSLTASAGSIDDPNQVTDLTYTLTLSCTDGLAENFTNTATITIHPPSQTTLTVPNQSQGDTTPVSGDTVIHLSDGTAVTQVSTVGLPGSSCGCTDPGMALTDNGATVAVRPIFQTTLPIPAGAAVPARVDITLSWNSSSQPVVSFYPTGHSGGDVLLMDVQSAVTVTSSGSYPWASTVQEFATAGATMAYATFNQSGTAHEDVSSASEGVRAGNGWTISGVDRLIATGDGVEWKDGQGNGRFFVGTGAGSMAYSYTSPAGDFGGLVQQTDGSYTYSGKGGLWTDYFNSSGLETGKVTADGQRTTFTYSGTQLTGIAGPDGRPVTLTYDGSGNLQTVATPGRLATLTHDASGNLTALQHPDGALLSFGYDTAGRPVFEQTSARLTTFAYDSAGHGTLTGVDNGLGAMLGVAPQLGQGFINSGANISAAAGVVTDALSRSTRHVLNGNGQLVQLQTGDGVTQAWTYNANFQPLRWTDGLGRVTSFAYNAGDQTSVTTPDGATTTFQYDPSLHEVTQIQDPLGRLQTFVYSGTGDLQVSVDAAGLRTTNTWSGGLLQSTTDPQGLTTSFVYDGQNDLIAVIEPTGLRTSFAYDAAGDRTSVTDPLGNITTTLFDAMGRPTGAINPDGTRTTQTYDGAGNLVSSSDVYGKLTTNVYDAAGRQVATIDPLGNRTTAVYDAAGQVQATEDPYGHYTTFTYDGAGRQVGTLDPFGNRTTSVYDNAGQLTASIDRYGSATTFLYDSAGRQVVTQDPYGHYTTTVYDASGATVAQVDIYGNRTTFLYDSAGRPVATEDRYGHYTTIIYDSAGRVQATQDVYGHYTTTLYDSYGRVQATEDVYGNFVTTSYDAYGRVQATLDGLGNRVTTLYDGLGRVVATQDPTGTVTTVYDADGQVQATIDQLGNRTTTVYDGYGRVVATEDPLATYVTTAYDGYGRVQASIDQLGHAVTTVYDVYGRAQASIDQLGNRTTLLYDASGRQVATENALGQYTTLVYDSLGRVAAGIDGLGNRTTTLYDGFGRAAATLDPLGRYTSVIFDSSGRQAATEDAGGNYTTSVYDAYGRVAATEDPLGRYTTSVYDSYGRPAATEDALAHYTSTVYDGYGRQVASVDALGNRTTSVLDSLGRQVNLIDADGNKTTFVYDGLGRVVQQTDPLGHSGTMAYDRDGRLLSATDRDGRRIDHVYDAAGRETGQTWYNADGTVADRVTFTYDAAGNQLTAANGAGTSTLTYDGLGRVNVVNDLWGNTLTFTYDSAGNRTLVQDNFGGTTTSVYDADRELTSRQFGGPSQTPLRIDQTYLPTGQVGTQTRFSNLAGTVTVATTSFTYDAAGQITNLQHKNRLGSNLANYTTTFDGAGNVQTETKNGVTVTFTSDAANQLTGDGVTTHTYDGAGNRTGAGYATTANEQTSDGTWTYFYDAQGDETKKIKAGTGETWLYAYDNRDHLVQAQDWSVDPQTYGPQVLYLQENFKYDAWGNRVQAAIQGGSTQRYAVDGWDPAKPAPVGNENFDVWADLDGSNALQTRYLRGDAVDELFARIGADTNAYWTLTDRLGSVRDVTDNSGVIKDTIAYDGFGNIVSESNSGYRGRYGWTGREFYTELNLQSNRDRWYDPKTGRWMTQDPIGFNAGDSNLYRYVGNAAANHIDPSGYWGIVRGPQGGNAPSLDWPPANIRDPARLTLPISPYRPDPVPLPVGPLPGLPPLPPPPPLGLRNRNETIREIGVALAQLEVELGRTTDPAEREQIGDMIRQLRESLSRVIVGGNPGLRTPSQAGDWFDPIEGLGQLGAGLIIPRLPVPGIAPNCPTAPADSPLRWAIGGGFRRRALTQIAPRTITRIGDLTRQEAATLAEVWRGTQPVTALPLEVRQQLARLYSGVASENVPGFAQAAFNEARARYLLGQGPNPGPSVVEFAQRMGIPVHRAGQ